MSLFISCFIYCNSTSRPQTSIIFGPDPKGLSCHIAGLCFECHYTFVFYSSSHVLSKTVMAEDWERFSFLSKRGRDVDFGLIGPLRTAGPRCTNEKREKNI